MAATDWKSGLLTALREVEGLDYRDRIVLGALISGASFAREGLHAGRLLYTRSISFLARDAAYANQTVYAALGALEEAGFISSHGQSGPRPTTWEINYERITDEPPF